MSVVMKNLLALIAAIIITKVVSGISLRQIINECRDVSLFYEITDRLFCQRNLHDYHVRTSKILKEKEKYFVSRCVRSFNFNGHVRSLDSCNSSCMDDLIAKSEDGEEEEGYRYEKGSDLQSCDYLTLKDEVKVFLSEFTCKFCPF
jgi:hypothetical protein